MCRAPNWIDLHDDHTDNNACEESVERTDNVKKCDDTKTLKFVLNNI